MADFLADMPLIIRRELYFMHDGGPAHFSLVARRYLNRKFPGRWIGRGGPITWPPLSPDLNPEVLEILEADPPDSYST
jgi:hypothetical protein